ncbi:dicarboxylate/amino acid:cation symporter [Spiroplasma culicicola]|uniref:L-cystine uptake protein TcyP n=1 Tax=Spiroplasma culicicola AES-1 TaxID=1276246 RepID=W6A6V0_9MOLU|nr:dicarboxylate/amino acid:cation symporter [Spiroplasma culicicola]AHI52686.1 proton/glutamate symporter [Spiroplasma culicicola AES-1]
MNFLAEENRGILETFIAISTWQSLLGILIFIGIQVGFWIFLKKQKLQFMYRILIGMAIGLLFGIVIQSIIGFPESLGDYDEPGNEYYWIYELSIWANFFKNVFINGVMLLTIPIVFVAMFRVTSKPTSRGVGRITLKGGLFFLFNVFISFTFTFFVGVAAKVGKGFELIPDDGYVGKDNVPLPQLIWQYIPNNLFGSLASNVIVPVMVVGALAGISVRILSKRKTVEMEAIRKSMDTGWDIIMSMLMTFMKIMPLAVMSMLATAIFTRPIGSLATIGKVIGIGYLGIAFSIGYLTLLVFVFGLNVKGWWKQAWKPLVQGFATQSSNATLPITMSTLKEDMKINESATGTLAPLSTTVGLIACAGVQAGLATSILWTGDGNAVEIGLLQFYFLGLLITLIASLGIAGVPGTATVVTVGVLGGLGYGAFINSVLEIIAPLDGLFDMGRTGANVLAAVAVTPIVAKSEGMIEKDSPLLNEKGLFKQDQILKMREIKENSLEQINNLTKTLDKQLRNKELDSAKKAELKKETSEQIHQIRANKKASLQEIKTQKLQ